MTNVKLKSRMLEKGVSGYELARKIGVSDSQFSRIARGWVNPVIGIKEKLAGLLDCSVEQIFPEDQQTKDSEEYVP